MFNDHPPVWLGGKELNNPFGTAIMGLTVLDASGFIGQEFSLTDAGALSYSDTTIGTLRRGVYMLVRVASTRTLANCLRGRAVFWSARDTYTVTDAVAAGTRGNVAGILLCNLESTDTYAIIQRQGIATVKYQASVTSAAADLLVVTVSATNELDTVADATSVTGIIRKAAIGTAIEAAANGALKLVDLSILHGA